MSAVRRTPREIALLMAREIDPQPGSPDDNEYIHEWVPGHLHEEWEYGPDCAACWMHDYDRAVSGGKE
jgi:hypothetical protein